MSIGFASERGASGTEMAGGKSETFVRTLPSTERSLPIVLMRAREKVMAPIRDMLSKSGITEQQWRVLRVLAEFGPLDSSGLADKACLLLPSLTRIAQSMVEKGYITRTADTGDRRRQTLAITPEGQQVIDDNLPAALRIAELFKSTLGEEKYENLLDILQELDRLPGTTEMIPDREDGR